MDNRTCPRCGAVLPPSAYYEEMPTAPGRLPAYRVRHSREAGGWCVAYAGPEVATTAKPLGDTAEGLTGRELLPAN